MGLDIYGLIMVALVILLAFQIARHPADKHAVYTFVVWSFHFTIKNIAIYLFDTIVLSVIKGKVALDSSTVDMVEAALLFYLIGYWAFTITSRLVDYIWSRITLAMLPLMIKPSERRANSAVSGRITAPLQQGSSSSSSRTVLQPRSTRNDAGSGLARRRNDLTGTASALRRAQDQLREAKQQLTPRNAEFTQRFLEFDRQADEARAQLVDGGQWQPVDEGQWQPVFVRDTFRPQGETDSEL